MKPYLTLSFVAVPLLAACAGGVGHPALHSVQVDALPRPAPASPPRLDAEWVTAVVSAKAAGSLYRNGAFFPPFAAAADPVLALP